MLTVQSGSEDVNQMRVKVRDMDNERVGERTFDTQESTARNIKLKQTERWYSLDMCTCNLFAALDRLLGRGV